MKLNVTFLVVRCNNKIIFVDAIYDTSTNIQILIEQKDLDTETVNFLKSSSLFKEVKTFLGDAFIENIISTPTKLCGNYANMNITIENKVVDVDFD